MNLKKSSSSLKKLGIQQNDLPVHKGFLMMVKLTQVEKAENNSFLILD